MKSIFHCRLEALKSSKECNKIEKSASSRTDTSVSSAGGLSLVCPREISKISPATFSSAVSSQFTKPEASQSNEETSAVNNLVRSNVVVEDCLKDPPSISGTLQVIVGECTTEQCAAESSKQHDNTNDRNANVVTFENIVTFSCEPVENESNVEPIAVSNLDAYPRETVLNDLCHGKLNTTNCPDTVLINFQQKDLDLCKTALDFLNASKQSQAEVERNCSSKNSETTFETSKKIELVSRDVDHAEAIVDSKLRNVNCTTADKNEKPHSSHSGRDRKRRCDDIDESLTSKKKQRNDDSLYISNISENIAH